MLTTTRLPDSYLKRYKLEHTTYNSAVDDQGIVVPLQVGTILRFFVEEKHCPSPKNQALWGVLETLPGNKRSERDADHPPLHFPG